MNTIEKGISMGLTEAQVRDLISFYDLSHRQRRRDKCAICDKPLTPYEIASITPYDVNFVCILHMEAAGVYQVDEYRRRLGIGPEPLCLEYPVDETREVRRKNYWVICPEIIERYGLTMSGDKEKRYFVSSESGKYSLFERVDGGVKWIGEVEESWELEKLYMEVTGEELIIDQKKT